MSVLPHRRADAPPRVLIADADDVTRARHCDVLIKTGCDVIEACDGREALVHALVRTPSLVVTELNLPIVDGIALCEILRKDRATSKVPILVVTRETDRSKLAQARRAGADHLLSKPAPLASLLREVKRLLLQSEDPGRRSSAARRKAAEQIVKSAHVLKASAGQHPIPREYYSVMTTTPPDEPPALSCPECLERLRYTISQLGGISPDHAEQWDYYRCETCGEFRYRHRTRKLRHVV